MPLSDITVVETERVTSTMTTTELIESLMANGVPCAPIQTYDEVVTEPALDARGFYWDAPHPTVDDVRQVGSPMRLSRTPVRRGNAAPLLGNATDRVMAELNESPTSEAPE